jgi:hypothetical protein
VHIAAHHIARAIIFGDHRRAIILEPGHQTARHIKLRQAPQRIITQIHIGLAAASDAAESIKRVIAKAALAIRRQIAVRPDRGQRARNGARLGDVDDLIERIMIIDRGLVGMAAESKIAARIGPLGDLTRRIVLKAQRADVTASNPLHFR